MIFDWLIFYTLDGVRRVFLASETDRDRAYQDLLDYVDHELERSIADVSDVTIDCEGLSPFQF
jgi:hypothetical protein